MRYASLRERLLKSSELFFYLQLPAERKYLQLVRQFVDDICRRSGVPGEIIEDMIYITGEAVSNVVKHAYEDVEDPEKKILELEVKIRKNDIQLKISDFGKGFDKGAYRKLNRDGIKEKVKQRHKGGLGLYMIDKLADELTITIDPYRKNQVIIIKRF